MTVNITPNVQDIEQSIQLGSVDDRVQAQEQALSKLFKETYPANDDIHEIVIKVSALNTLYSTQLRNKVYSVSKHILSLDIDDRIATGDKTVVDDIIKTPIGNGKYYRCYSFATKYCSFHNPDAFPIYDSYVDEVLMWLYANDGFSQTEKLKNRDYKTFCATIEKLKENYKFEKYSTKQIDKYLWQLGRELKRHHGMRN